MSLKDVGYTHQCSQYSQYRGFNCMLFLIFISVAYTWKSSGKLCFLNRLQARKKEKNCVLVIWIKFHAWTFYK